MPSGCNFSLRAQMRVYKKLHPNIPISQYPNIILYRDTTFPISQYPNIPIYIGILGYRDAHANQEQLFKEARTNTHAKQASCYWALGPYCPPHSAFCLACVFVPPGHQNTCQAERVVRWTVWADGPSNKRPAWHVFWCGATASRATERPGTAKTTT